MRIVELPFHFCSGMQLPLAVLINRRDKQTVTHDIYIGDNYTFSGSVTPTSYQLLRSHNRFAQHGYVVTDYPAATFTIDRETGIVVKLDGADTILDEQSAFNALADEFLLFVDDEIMSVVAVQLLELNTYRLQVIRERMATPRQAHSTFAEVYLLAKKDLLPLTHRSFNVDNEISLKVATATGHVAQDLADLDEITHTIAGKIFTQTEPFTLRVKDTLRNPTYTGGTDLKLYWSLHELRSAIAAQFGVKTRTLLEIISLVDDSVLYSKLTYAQSFKILAARMAEILGAETSFIVRIRTDILGSNLHLQSAVKQITVTEP